MKNYHQLICLSALLLAPLAQTASASAQVYSGCANAAATNAFNNFKTAIKNKTNTDGKSITWDGVKLDGTDTNTNTRVIDFGKTVEIPVDRFRGVGAIYADPYTVSGDGFAGVNPATTGQFKAFSPKNTFAMFDAKNGQFADRNIQQSFVFPGTNNVAGTRGLGVIFLDVEKENESGIEYFGKDRSGNKVSLGKYYVPACADGDPAFLGVLFDSPIVADVEVIVGSKALFSFNGAQVRSFGAENLQKGIDLVVTDDFFFASPETLQMTDHEVNLDCFFNWAEKAYAPYLQPSGSRSQAIAEYSYRYYRNSNAYLGYSRNNKHLHYWPMDLKSGIIDIGEYSTWLARANCF